VVATGAIRRTNYGQIITIKYNIQLFTGRMSFLSPNQQCQSTTQQNDTKFVNTDYVNEQNICSKFGENPFTGAFGAIR